MPRVRRKTVKEKIEKMISVRRDEYGDPYAAFKILVFLTDEILEDKRAAASFIQNIIIEESTHFANKTRRRILALHDKKRRKK